MYLSEQEAFSDFDNENALVWKKTGLMYGDWTSGPNGDGSYEKSMEIDTPEVRKKITFLRPVAKVAESKTLVLLF